MTCPFKRAAHPSIYWEAAGPCPCCGSRRVGLTENYLTSMIALVHCYDCGHRAEGTGESIRAAEDAAREKWKGSVET